MSQAGRQMFYLTPAWAIAGWGGLGAAHEGGRIRRLKKSGAGDQNVGAVVQAGLECMGIDSAVHFQHTVELLRIDPTPEEGELRHGIREKGLPAEARLYGHDQQHRA